MKFISLLALKQLFGNQIIKDINKPLIIEYIGDKCDLKLIFDTGYGVSGAETNGQ